MHGSGLEVGAFGSSLDSRDLGAGYGGGAKVEINPIDLVSVDARAGWIHFSDVNVDMVPLEAAALLNFSALGERIVAYVGAGGGYILAPSHHIQPDTPLENVLAVYQTVAKRRRG